MVDEFCCIDKFLKPLSEAGSHNLLDDTATLGSYALSTDTIIEGVHFVGDETPQSLAIKLLGVNLSDLASVGATPSHYTLNISLPKDTDHNWWADFTNGLSHIQKKYNITLLGGDTTTGTSQIVLSATVYGHAIDNPPLRCNAKVGDIVCMVGYAGAGAFGLLCAKGIIKDDILLQHYQMPQPQIGEGQILAPLVNAMADVSDGIVADCFNIAKASGVGMTLRANDIKLHPNIQDHLQAVDNVQQLALTGGDDYILVCTMHKNNFDEAQKLLLLTEIGIVNEDTLCTLIDNDNNIINYKGKYGYEHT